VSSNEKVINIAFLADMSQSGPISAAKTPTEAGEVIAPIKVIDWNNKLPSTSNLYKLLIFN